MAEQSKEPRFVALETYHEYSPDEMASRAKSFYENIRRRRTVRDFSDREVDDAIVKDCILAAGTAPNGANLQPWHFAVIKSAETKKQIREAAELEEREFYERLAPQEWLDALAPLGTDSNKPFLEIAPYLIVIFSKATDVLDDGSVVKNYYSTESTGIATGMLITALHEAGLATLTHTPSPMKFLNQILDRPKNERPFLILVVGYPTEDAQVPDITKKPIEDITSWH